MQIFESAQFKRIHECADRIQQAFDPYVAAPPNLKSKEQLKRELFELRQVLARELWTALVVELRKHRLFSSMQQEAFCRRAFNKPRGYAGDAVILDWMYGTEDSSLIPNEPMPPLGQAIYETFSAQSFAVRAVCKRRHLLAHSIDEAARQFGRPRIMSVACGHLREAKLSSAILEELVGELIAVDHDPESLQELEQSYSATCIKPVRSSIKRILTGQTDVGGNFHMIYAAGIYDYLDDVTAPLVTHRLFQMLAPGGKLLYANFLDTNPEAGWMEVAMDWWLIHRNQQQIADCAKLISADQLAELKVWSDDLATIGYAVVTKKD